MEWYWVIVIAVASVYLTIGIAIFFADLVITIRTDVLRRQRHLFVKSWKIRNLLWPIEIIVWPIVIKEISADNKSYQHLKTRYPEHKRG